MNFVLYNRDKIFSIKISANSWFKCTNVYYISARRLWSGLYQRFRHSFNSNRDAFFQRLSCRINSIRGLFAYAHTALHLPVCTFIILPFSNTVVRTSLNKLLSTSFRSKYSLTTTSYAQERAYLNMQHVFKYKLRYVLRIWCKKARRPIR